MNSQQNEPVFSQPPAVVSQESPQYTVADTVYAWLSLLFAFLFCQAMPVAEHPLGGFLLIATLYASGFVILGLNKVKLCPACILSAVSALVIGAALLLTNARFLIKLSMAYSLASYCYFLYAALGNRIERGFSNYIYIDFIKILLIFPFGSFGKIFSALSNKSARKGSMLLLKILVGGVIAVVPTFLVLLLLSYDSDFMKLLNDIFSVEKNDVSHTVVSLIFSLPLGMYGFGLYASSERKLLQERMTAERCANTLRGIKILPQLTALVAALPILFLYVVFFISQWKYYVSGFTGVLPDAISYAEYARQGFFELCAVSVINLVMITVAAFFTKQGKNGTSLILKILAPAFCLCTLILISTAVAKLVMYIDSYGLTQKRIYAMWLMALIAILFPVIAVSQFLRKPKAVALCLSAAIVMFAGLCVCDVNAVCAQYNTDRYLAGSLETIDVDVMEELGDSAIPSLVKASEALYGNQEEYALKVQIDILLQKKLEQIEEEDFSLFSFSVPAARAKAALKAYAAAGQKPAQ